MKQTIKNNEIALERFLTDIRSKTLAFAVFRVRDEEVALDLLQETMMGFVKSADNYDEEAWTNLFYKILTRRITDWRRKETWRRKLRHIMPFSNLTESESEAREYDNNLTDADNTQTNPAQSQLGADELADQFQAVLALLPPRQQEAYLLRQWQGLSTKETASIMKCSEGSVKTHFFRAMKSLKEELGEWLNES